MKTLFRNLRLITIFLIFASELQAQKPWPQNVLFSGFRGIMPTVYSLKEYMPTIGDQGETGTTVAWTTTYMRTAMEARKKNLKGNTAAIDAIRFSPTYIYELIKAPSDTDWQGGANIEDAFKVMKTKGNVLLKDLPFGITKKKMGQFDLKAAAFRIKEFYTLFSPEASPETKILTMKVALENTQNLLVIGVVVPRSLFNATDVWTPDSLETMENGLGGHSLAVVGYDDDKYGGAFQLANSWGTTWGNQGYTWVKYDDLMRFIKYAYASEDESSHLFEQNQNSKPQAITKTNAPKRVALLVGMKPFSGFKPQKYLSLMEAKLKSLGFTVSVLIPNSDEEFRYGVNDFKQKYSNNAMTLFYFTGYGITRNNKAYMRFDSTLQQVVDVGEVSSQLPQSNEKLLIFDIGRPEVETLSRSWDILPVREVKTNTTLFFGCLESEGGLTLPSGEGLFTKAIVQQLIKGYTIDTFLNEASIQVQKDWKKAGLKIGQQPEIRRSISHRSGFRF